MGGHAFGPPRAPIAAQPLALAARRGSDNYDTWLSLTRSASASSPPHRRSGRGRGRREFGCPQPPAKDWLVGACGQTCESSPPAFAPPAACMHIAASRQHAQPRSRRVPVGLTLRRRPCHGCVFRAEAHRADIGRVPGDAPCGGGSSVREQARARQRRRLRARSPSPASASVPTPSTS